MASNQGRLRLVLGLACLASIIMVILSLGMSLPASPFATVELNGPTIAATDGNATAIVDSSSRRILILDENYELTRIVDLGTTTAPMDAATDICVSDGYAYVAGVKYRSDSSLIESENLLRYGLFRAPAVTLKEWSGERLYKPHIKSLNESDDGVFVTTVEGTTSNGFDYAEKTLLVTLFDKNGEEETVFMSEPLSIDVFSAGYDSNTDTLMTVSLRGVINDSYDVDEENPLAEYLFTDIDCASDNCIYATEGNSGAVYKIDVDNETVEAIISNVRFDALNVNNDVICAVSLSKNAVTIAGLDGHIDRTITSVTLSPQLMLFVLGVWASWAVLVASLLSLIVSRLRTMLRTREVGAIGSVLAGIAVVAAVSILITMSSYNAYEERFATRGKEISAFADIIDKALPAVSENMEAIGGRDAFRALGNEYEVAMDNANEVTNICADVSFPADSNGIGTYFTIYGKDDMGVYILYDSTDERTVGSTVMTADEQTMITHLFEDFDDSGKLHTGSSVRDLTLYRLVRIPSTDGTSTVGVVEFGSRTRSFAASVFESMVENTVEMLVLLFVVYIVYAEARGSGKCLLTYVRLKDEDKKRDAIALLTRPYTFVVSTLIAFDAVMSALIARSMVTNPAASGFLIALPAALQGVGLVLGQIAYGAFAPKAGVRRIVTTFAALMIAAAAVAVWAVSSNAFECYLGCKLVLGISFGLLYTLGYSLPRQASEQDLETEAAGGVRRTDTSAAALGTIMGGYASAYMGNEWVYVLLVVGGTLLICFAHWLFLPMKHGLEGKVRSVGQMWDKARGLFGSRELIALIFCVMLPVLMASGYNSFIFPLYCADLGLSTSAISRMCVLGQLVVYILIDGIEYANARFGKWRVELVALTLVGVTFILLSLNAVFTLASVTIVLVGVFCKAADAWKGLWSYQAQITKTPMSLSTGLMYATRSAILIVQPLVMSVMVKWPNAVGPLVLGCGALVGVTSFYLATRGSGMRTA